MVDKSRQHHSDSQSSGFCPTETFYKIGEEAAMRYQGIMYGRATVPPHADGGWALPGQEQTSCEVTAQTMAVRIDAEIAARESRRQPEKVVAPRTVTRRSIAEHVATDRAVKVVNSIDTGSVVAEALSSPAGEKLVLGVIVARPAHHPV